MIHQLPPAMLKGHLVYLSLNIILTAVVFSSPEPKAHKVSLWYSSRAGVRPSVRASVRVSTFSNSNYDKADRDQILSKASLRRGKGCIRFWARSDWNSGFHGNR